MPTTEHTRQLARARKAAQRARIAKAGGRQIAVHLGPEPSAALGRIAARHPTVKAAVEAAILAHAKTI